MSPFFVIVVTVNSVATVHGSYHKQARAEEDADRIRRTLVAHASHVEWTVQVAPIQFATAEAVRRIHGLNLPAEPPITLGQHKLTDFREVP